MEQVRIRLPEKVQWIIRKLKEQGFDAYAVGGCVRDSILGREPEDWDITTSAKPEEIKQIFRRTVDTGIEHGTVTVLAEKEGFAKFVSVQSHYNLIFREEEREMAKLCAEDHIAMTPYSSLAGGRLSKHPGETSKRLEEDDYARLKYDATAGQDNVIIQRAAELAERRGVSMTEISLAWLLTKVTAPVVGATKLSHIEGAAKAVELELSEDEIHYLEEPYIPHRLVGVMAQNTAASSGESHVWTTGKQKI